METRYIGRIKLSKEDSNEWKDNPPYMYVTNDCNRENIKKAILFENKDVCAINLKNSFKQHKHLPSSKMQIMTVSMHVDNIEDI